MKITIAIDIPTKEIMWQFVAAFEGGSNYWLNEIGAVTIGTFPDPKKPWYSDERVFEQAYSIELKYDNPKKGKPYASKTITQDDVVKGLAIMAAKVPHQFAALIDPDGTSADATTADVFLQCVLFGDVVYG